MPQRRVVGLQRKQPLVGLHLRPVLAGRRLGLQEAVQLGAERRAVLVGFKHRQARAPRLFRRRLQRQHRLRLGQHRGAPLGAGLLLPRRQHRLQADAPAGHRPRGLAAPLVQSRQAQQDFRVLRVEASHRLRRVHRRLPVLRGFRRRARGQERLPRRLPLVPLQLPPRQEQQSVHVLRRQRQQFRDHLVQERLFLRELLVSTEGKGAGFCASCAARPARRRATSAGGSMRESSRASEKRSRRNSGSRSKPLRIQPSAASMPSDASASSARRRYSRAAERQSPLAS